MTKTCFQCRKDIQEDEPSRFEDGPGCFHWYHSQCLVCELCGKVIESTHKVLWHNAHEVSSSIHRQCFRCGMCGELISMNEGRNRVDGVFNHWACFVGKKRKPPRPILSAKQHKAITADRVKVSGAEAEVVELLLKDYDGSLGRDADFAERLVELQSVLDRDSRYRTLFDKLYEKWEDIAGPWD